MKWRRAILEALPFLALWAAYFTFGLWLRRQIPLEELPGELHGYDYNAHGALFSDHHLILFTRFRHPLFGWLMSPITLFGARLAQLSFVVFWGYLSFIFSGIVTACVWMVYLLAAVGAWRLRHTRLLRLLAVSFAVDAAIHLVCFWGMAEAQIYCAHWFYALPLLCCGALAGPHASRTVNCGIMQSQKENG